MRMDARRDETRLCRGSVHDSPPGKMARHDRRPPEVQFFLLEYFFDRLQNQPKKRVLRLGVQTFEVRHQSFFQFL